jgi:YidC/Oxa1 family membrane protein insertase
LDKKSLIGMVLIALILGVWLYMSGPTKEQIERSKQVRDSIAKVENQAAQAEAAKIALDQAPAATISAAGLNAAAGQAPEVLDSLQRSEKQQKYRDVLVATEGKDEHFVIENDVVKATVFSKGGHIGRVELKNYHRPGSSEPLVLFEPDSTRFSLSLNAYDRSRLFQTDEFYFTPVSKTPTSIVMRLQTSKPGSFIEFTYSLKPGDYMLDASIRLSGMETIVSQTEDQLQLSWQMLYPSQEKHVNKEREAATIYFKDAVNDPDYLTPVEDAQQELNAADVRWISFKQQFFNSTIIAEKFFNKAGSFIRLSQRSDTATVKAVYAEVGIPFAHLTDEKFNFKFFFGPNHYNTLKTYDMGLEEIIPMGWSVFSYINKWLVIPLFNWLGFLNMGIVILILSIVMKIILLPIAYKTYMSSARMRVLKPETDALNAKFGKDADPMKKQQEQMALYRRAGVNPLSGCLPLLLQFPILIALFNFVPAAIELRQEGFLWADDLSTYDSIWDFGTVPFISWAYGDHVSLFALLMFVSTILYTWLNSSMMPQQSNAQMPGMKFMMYFMPVIFLAVMNTYAAGLSWYYFLANMLSFVQNWIIKRFVSDRKIRTQIEANMKKPAKVSGFQKRLEEMAKQRQQPVKRR